MTTILHKKKKMIKCYSALVTEGVLRFNRVMV